MTSIKTMVWLLLVLSVGTSAFADESVTDDSILLPPLEEPAKRVASKTLPSSTVSAVADGASQTTVSPSPSKIFGFLDLRPSYAPSSGSVRSENTVEAGYEFNPEYRLTYVQWWNTTANFYEGIYAHDGFFRFRANRVAGGSKLALNYQARLFLPTFVARQQAGFVGSVFNQLQLAWTVSPEVSVSVSTAPNIPFFTRAANAGRANLAFENLAVASFDWTVFPDLMVSLPFFFISRKARTVEGARGSSDWSHLLIFWPEVSYNLTKNVTVGLSYYTDNLVSSSIDALTLDNAFANGVFQAFWSLRI